MLKKHKNLLLGIIKEKGLDPKLFHGEDKMIDDENMFVIELVNSPMFFAVRNLETYFDVFSYHRTLFRPGFAKIQFGGNVDRLQYDFGEWLDNHTRLYIEEKVEPDLWESIALHEPLVTGAKLVSEDTDLFSDDEKVLLRMSINEFRLLVIKNFKPSADELKVIDDRLEYLSNSIDRLNKIDWRSVAITTLISISIALMLNAEQGRLLLDLFRQVFTSVLYLIQ